MAEDESASESSNSITGDQPDASPTQGQNSSDNTGDEPRRRRTRGAAASDRENGETNPDSASDERRFTQADLDRKIEQRLKRERERTADYEDVKSGAAETQRQMDDLRQSLGRALGFGKDDAPPDIPTLQATINELQSQVSGRDSNLSAKDEEIAVRDRAIAARDVELAAWRVAVQNGYDAATLMDLRSTERRLAQLDGSSDDFAKVLEIAIKEIAKDNPALRLAAREATASEAGIGTSGSRGADVNVLPGTARIRAGYGSPS